MCPAGRGADARRYVRPSSACYDSRHHVARRLPHISVHRCHRPLRRRRRRPVAPAADGRRLRPGGTLSCAGRDAARRRRHASPPPGCPTIGSGTATRSRRRRVHPRRPREEDARRARSITRRWRRRSRRQPARTIEPLNLGSGALTPSADGKTIAFNLDRKALELRRRGRGVHEHRRGQPATRRPAAGGRADAAAAAAARRPTSTDGKPLNMSPDGKRGVFIRDWNLWVRDVATRQERQLTTDGVKDFGYATDNAGWTQQRPRRSCCGRPTRRRSRRSSRTSARSARCTSSDHRRPSDAARRGSIRCPATASWRCCTASSSTSTPGKIVRLQMPPDFHRGDARRQHQHERLQLEPGRLAARARVGLARPQAGVLRVADAATGAVRTVFDEKVATHFESRTGWRVLWPTNEVIWYSQRDDWGHLYLYDLTTGAAEEPDHDRRRARSRRSCASTRRRARVWLRRQRPRAGTRIRTSALLPRRRSTASASRLAHARRRRCTTCSSRRPANTWSTRTRSRECRRWSTLRDARRQARHAAREGGHLEAAGDRLEAADSDHDEGADGKTDLYGLMFAPTKLRSDEEVSDHQQRLSRAAERQHGQPRLHRRARRSSGARRARLRRRHDRRHAARRAARSRSRTPTTARWAATTRSPIRSPA